MGAYLILTQNPNANSFPDTRIKPGRYLSCMIAKILKLARNLVFVWAGLLVVLTLTFNKAECFFPCLIRD